MPVWLAILLAIAVMISSLFDTNDNDDDDDPIYGKGL